MKKIYHLYNENFEITHAQIFIEGEQPENAVYIELNNFIKAMVNPETLEVYEGATAEEIANQQMEQLKARETEMYKKRTQDGINAYAEISAEFRLAKLAGVISEEQHGAIEETLIPVRNEVLAGQWISALQKLEAIGVAIGSELYDRLHTQISNYIAENYDLPN
jgi:PHD/YefM family antitoxin component YafN of YafNO toxin-antitoxin module